MLNETRYERKDCVIAHRDKSITLTLFEPEYRNEWVLLYLHGNSSSRLECTGVIKFLPFRFSLASFDFIGCGLNHEDDAISLGVREAEQVETVVGFLQKASSRVIIWGRSMGAATALKFGKAPIIVADSSFKSFKSLCRQIAKENSPKFIPNCLISCLFPCVFCKLRSDIEEQGHYDIEKLDILEDVRRISESTMIVFMSGDEDKLIDKANSEKLYNAFRGRNKHLEIFKGTHNTKRPEETIKKIMKMIAEFITQEEFHRKEALSRTKIEIDLNEES